MTNEEEFEKVWEFEYPSGVHPEGCLCQACESEISDKPFALHWWLEKGKRDREKIEKLKNGIREFLARCHGENHGIPDFVWDELKELLGEMK